MNALPPTPDTPNVHPTYARMLCMQLRALGVDVDAALAAAGLGPWRELATSDALLGHRTVSRLARAAIAASGRPWLGLELGAAVQVSAHGPLGYAAVASRDLRQALETVARYGGLRNGTMRYRIDPRPHGLALAVVERVDLGEVRGFVVDTVFATLMRLIEAVTGESRPRVDVGLPFAAPSWQHEYARHTAGAVRFGASHLSFAFEDDRLDAPCPTADANAFAAACRECEAALARRDTAGTLVERVRELLRGSDDAYPALGAVAAHFALSPRTLMRHLQREGSRYQALLDEARRDRALWYLRHTQHPVEAIAARLGYQDATNFSRTFRRWVGVTPGEARRGEGPASSWQTSIDGSSSSRVASTQPRPSRRR